MDGSTSAMSVETGRLERMEMPRSPVRNADRECHSCTMIGLSSPCAAMIPAIPCSVQPLCGLRRTLVTGSPGRTPTPHNLATAADWLANQPASTIRAQARAVVAATGEAAFLDDLRVAAKSGLPIHLLAGARSRAGWNVPDWLAHKATTDTVIPGTGHLMMLEQPQLFADAVLTNLADH